MRNFMRNLRYRPKAKKTNNRKRTNGRVIQRVVGKDGKIKYIRHE